MYARGMTGRTIQGFLLDQYKVEVGGDFISAIIGSTLPKWITIPALLTP